MTTASFRGDTNVSVDGALHVKDIKASPSGFSLDVYGGLTGSVQVEGSGLTYEDGLPSGGIVTGVQAEFSNGLSVDAHDFSIPVTTVEQWIENADIAGALDELLKGNDLITFDPSVASNDVVATRGGNDTVLAGAGNDLIYGNQGNDQLFGNTGRDTLYGGQGADYLRGGKDDDALFGDRDNDLVYGDLGNDVLHGGKGDDTVYGGKGDDTLFGDLGNDLLVGGQGADTYVFGQNSGADVIQGFNQAEGDRLDIQGQSYTTGSAAGGSALLVLSGGGTIELAGVTHDQVNAGFFGSAQT